jgi:hypothetical protein
VVVRPRLRRTLFWKYAVYFAGLVSIALLTSGLVELLFLYRESRVLVEALQREKVRTVALRIEQFARLIEAQLRAPLLLRQAGASESPNELALELIRLLRQAPAVIGRRLDRRRGGPAGEGIANRSRRDRPRESWIDNPAYVAARSGALYVSPGQFPR